MLRIRATDERVNNRDIALAILAAVIWGATFPLTRLGLDETPPLLFAALRFAAAALLIVVVPRPPIGWPWLIATGVFLGAGQYGFLFVAMAAGMPPGLASLLIHTQAVFTILIAWVAFKETLDIRQWCSVSLATLGLGVLILERASPATPFAVLLIIFGAVCAALGNNILKIVGASQPAAVAIWMSVVVPLPMLALSAQFDPGNLGSNFAAVGWQTIATVAYSAYLATVIAFAIWGRLLSRYPATYVAPFFLLVPVVGISLSVIIFDEHFTPWRASGCALIFLALAVSLTNRLR